MMKSFQFNNIVSYYMHKSMKNRKKIKVQLKFSINKSNKIKNYKIKNIKDLQERRYFAIGLISKLKVLQNKGMMHIKSIAIITVFQSIIKTQD